MKKGMAILMMAVLLIFIVAPVNALPPKGERMSGIDYNDVQIITDHGWGGENGVVSDESAWQEPNKSPTPLDGTWIPVWAWINALIKAYGFVH